MFKDKILTKYDFIFILLFININKMKKLLGLTVTSGLGYVYFSTHPKDTRSIIELVAPSYAAQYTPEAMYYDVKEQLDRIDPNDLSVVHPGFEDLPTFDTKMLKLLSQEKSVLSYWSFSKTQKPMNTVQEKNVILTGMTQKQKIPNTQNIVHPK